MGGWFEEAYEAKYRAGRTALQMGLPWAQVQQLFLDAHAYLPARAEPLHSLARHLYYRRKPRPHALVFLYAHRAASMAFPKHLRLFIDHTVYNFKAHYLTAMVAHVIGEHRAGLQATRQALKAQPNNQDMKKKLHFYKTKLGLQKSGNWNKGKGKNNKKGKK